MGKEIAGLRRTRKRGVERVGLSARLILCACSLVHLGNLLGSPPEPTVLATA